MFTELRFRGFVMTKEVMLTGGRSQSWAQVVGGTWRRGEEARRPGQKGSRQTRSYIDSGLSGREMPRRRACCLRCPSRGALGGAARDGGGRRRGLTASRAAVGIFLRRRHDSETGDRRRRVTSGGDRRRHRDSRSSSSSSNYGRMAAAGQDTLVARGSGRDRGTVIWR